MKWCLLFILSFLFLWLLTSSACSAQGRSGNDSTRTVHDTTGVDSLRLINPNPFTISLDSSSLKNIHHKRPWVAVGLSAAIPGAGQIYNQNYWKPPIVWGLGGYWVYEWFQMNSQYKDYRNQYSQSISPILPLGNGQLQQLRDFYRDERDKFAWYLGALYFLNLVDAYVSASLFDFDIGSDLGMRGQSSPGVIATIRWKL